MEAKLLVLDLLGWGVPSSHLLECGLHPRLIYAIFSELHLQFPYNLDVAEFQQQASQSSSGHQLSTSDTLQEEVSHR
jgi:hypothetical protein